MNDSKNSSKGLLVLKVSTLGTTVILNNGAELAGVTSIRIAAETDDVWRATITLEVFLSNVGEMESKPL